MSDAHRLLGRALGGVNLALGVARDAGRSDAVRQLRALRFQLRSYLNGDDCEAYQAVGMSLGELGQQAHPPTANFGSIEARISQGHVTGDRPSEDDDPFIITYADGRQVRVRTYRPSKQEIQAKMEKAKQMEDLSCFCDAYGICWNCAGRVYDWAKQGI